MDVLETIASSGLVAVARIERAGEAVDLAATLLEAGLPCIEVTYRTEAAPDAIRRIRESVPEAVVGVGTVLSVAQLDRALDAGAAYVVCPGLKMDVIDRCIELGVPVIPGILTPTELIQALERGLSTVKLFPASAAGGPSYIRALAGPFPMAKFVPTGGIELDNLAGYLSIPSVIAVGGSWMVRPDLLAAGDWASVASLAAAAAQLVRELRAPATA